MKPLLSLAFSQHLVIELELENDRFPSTPSNYILTLEYIVPVVIMNGNQELVDN